MLNFFKSIGKAIKALDAIYSNDGSDYIKRRDLARNLLINALFGEGYELDNPNDMKPVKSESRRLLQPTALYALFSISANRIETFEGIYISQQAAANSIAHRIDDNSLIGLAFTGDCKGYKIRPTNLV
jgi:hypothetical protein